MASNSSRAASQRKTEVSTVTLHDANVIVDICSDSKKEQESSMNRVLEFIENFKHQTEALVTDTFPQKVLDIEEVYQKMVAEKLSDVHSDINIPVPEPVRQDGDEPANKKRKLDANGSGGLPSEAPAVTGTPVLVFPNGKVPYNTYIHNWVENIKPLIMDLMEHANMTQSGEHAIFTDTPPTSTTHCMISGSEPPRTIVPMKDRVSNQEIKMWISFLIPKIEDGNNFGVSIQEDTMAEARQVETESATYLDQLSRYYISRAKIISKIAKYPHVEDYRQSIRELDEKQIVCLRLTLCEMRNHYASLHDIINKNMDKIKKPRSGNAENLY